MGALLGQQLPPPSDFRFPVPFRSAAPFSLSFSALQFFSLPVSVALQAAHSIFHAKPGCCCCCIYKLHFASGQTVKPRRSFTAGQRN